MVHDVPVHPRCGASNILHSDFNFIGYYLNKNSYSHKVNHTSAKWPNNHAHYESVYYLPVFNRFHHITQWKKSTDGSLHVKPPNGYKLDETWSTC